MREKRQCGWLLLFPGSKTRVKVVIMTTLLVLLTGVTGTNADIELHSHMMGGLDTAGTYY